MDKRISSRGITKWSTTLIAIPITSGGSLQQKRESTHCPLLLPSWPGDSTREFMLRPWWEWKGELSAQPKNTRCCAAGNHGNHQHFFKLHFWSAQNTGVSSHLCLPCSTKLCPTRRNPASLYPSACKASGSPYSFSLQKQLVLDIVLKCEHSTPQLGNKILAMKM